MHCPDVVDRLLATEGADDDRDVAQHVAGCTRCASVAHGLTRLDVVLRTTLVVAPPLELQQSLAALARAAARPAPTPGAWATAVERLRQWWNAWMPQPNVATAQGVAAITFVLAGWQLFNWMNAFAPVLGDVPYAMELVAASPALGYLSGVQLDVQSLGLWTLIGGAGWLVSESSPLSTYVARLRRP